MAGTKDGGYKTAITNKLKYGEDYYRQIGARGGAASSTGGFYGNRELAREAGRIGGAMSKRTADPNKTHCIHGHEYTPENTSLHKGARKCRECNRLRMRDYNARKRMEARR